MEGEWERLAFAKAPLGLILAENRVIRQVNARFAEMFGAAPDSFTDMPLIRLYPSPEDFERIGAHGLAVMRESGRYADERVMRRLPGALFWCRVAGQSLTPDDPFRRAVWAFTDLAAERPVVALTPRERAVALATAQGMTSKEIGRALGISHRTVEAHRARLMEKLAARNLAGLVAKVSGMPL